MGTFLSLMELSQNHFRAARVNKLLRSPCPSKAILGCYNQSIKKRVASPTGICCLQFFLICGDCSFSGKKYLQFNTIIQPFFPFPLIFDGISSHIHLGKGIHNGCGSLLYYKKLLYIGTLTGKRGRNPLF